MWVSPKMKKITNESWYWRHKKGSPRETYPGRNGKVIVTKQADKSIKQKRFEYAKELEYQEKLATELKKFC